MKIIIAVLIVVFIVIISAVVISNNDNNNQKYLVNYINDLGYKFDEDGSIYKRIVSNNSLDEYYRDIKSNKDSHYLEYYFSMDSYMFIQLYMAHSNGVNNVFNAMSDLNSNEITFTYEITKKDASLILEGTYSIDNSIPYSCDAVSLKKASNDAVAGYCDNALLLVQEFVNEKKNLLNDEEFRNIVNMPKSEIVIRDK